MPRDLARRVPAFCDDVERLDEDRSSSASGCTRAKRRRWCRPCSSTGRCSARQRRRRVVVSGCVAADGLLLDLAGRAAGCGGEDFEARCWRAPRRWATIPLRRGPRTARGAARRRGSSTSWRRARPGGRERLLLQVAALLHDIGIYVSLRGASQALAVSPGRVADLRAVGRRDGGRRQRRPLSSPRAAAAEPSAVLALDRQDRLIVNKLAAILRVANALDAEHLQKVRDLRLVRDDGDLGARARWHRRHRRWSRWPRRRGPTCSSRSSAGSSSSAAGSARRDARHATHVRQPGSSTASSRGWRSTSACSRRRRTPRCRCSSASSSPRSPRRTSTSSSWSAWRASSRTSRTATCRRIPRA